MKVFVVIDTNVLVSALLSSHSDSATSIILANLFDDKIVPLYNDEILQEYEEVLHRSKFHFSESDVRLVLTAISEYGIAAERVKCNMIFLIQRTSFFMESHFQKKGLFSSPEISSTFLKSPLSSRQLNF